MGCSVCKCRRPPKALDNNSLLDDPSTTIQDRSSGSLHSDPVLQTLKPPPLLPGIRKLQQIIIQILQSTESYDLYPTHSGFSAVWNASRIAQERQAMSKRLLAIALDIAMFANGANTAYKLNLRNALNHALRSNLGLLLLPELLQLIVAFVPVLCFSADTIEDNDQRDMVSFSSERGTVRFEHMDTDFLNIRSQSPLLGAHLLLSCLVLRKGDEMWMGLVERSAYRITAEIEKERGSLLLYGARESSIESKRRLSEWDDGRGAIHGFGRVVAHTEPFRSGDWTTFALAMHTEHPHCAIFKNGKMLVEVDAPISEKMFLR